MKGTPWSRQTWFADSVLWLSSPQFVEQQKGVTPLSALRREGGGGKQSSIMGPIDRNETKTIQKIFLKNLAAVLGSNYSLICEHPTFESCKNTALLAASATLSGSLCLWRHEQGWRMWQKRLLRHESTFGCSSLEKKRANTASPWESQIHRKTVFLLHEYW